MHELETISPEMRRFTVPGGFLYQVRTQGSGDWSAPVYVADIAATMAQVSGQVEQQMSSIQSMLSAIEI
jgi:hypothetical protein